MTGIKDLSTTSTNCYKLHFREALRLHRGDLIDVLETNPNGTWRGWCRGRVGTFKFLNVETIPRPLPGPQVAPVQGGQGGQVKAGSVQELLTSLGLGHFLSVFILNGHDTLASLRTLDTRQLEYFGIMDPSKQTQLLAAVQVSHC